MKTLHVELGERSYPIYIGRQLLGVESLIAPHVAGRQVMVVSNETVAPLYLEKTLQSLSAFDCDSVILPDGEVYKDLSHLNLIFDALLSKRHNRQTTLVALGGGVVGDMTGFAAASYQRGVDFIQVPTTLLAQVDSSVGGKTGVNHAMGKNMIGAFHQPRCVIADTDSLNTLEERQLSAGLAEVIKYGLLGDRDFFDWLEQSMDSLRARQPEALSHAIERSCQNKADVVAADEREAGRRALLNLGHTFGHAIETGAGYGTWLHGEAVGAGMHMAADMSARLGWLAREDVDRIGALLQRAGLPIGKPAELDTRRMLDLMAVDKKVLSGQLRLVLMKAIGDAVVIGDFKQQALLDTLDNTGQATP